MRKPIWILDSILPVNVCGASAVLEIIDSDLPIEVVVNAAKIDPEMRHLMDEKRSSVQILCIVDFLPFKRRNPLGGKDSGKFPQFSFLATRRSEIAGCS